MDLGGLLGDMARFAVLGGEFSFVVWCLVTGVLLMVGALFVAVARAVVDPIAVVVAVRPGRVLVWMGITVVVAPLLVGLLFATWVAAPLAIVFLFALLLAAGLGIIATALVVGDRALRALGAPHPELASVSVGILVFRLLRLVPLVGPPAWALVVWFSTAAVCAVAFELSLSWHRRRLPDAAQFEGEGPIEWHDQQHDRPSGH